MKIQNKIQTRNAQVRAESVNEAERTAEFIISTEAVDTYKTVFKADGWMMDRYETNPIVCYNHNHTDADHVIGTSEVFVEDGMLIGRVRFEAAENNPLAEKIFNKVKNEIIRGASISAEILDGRYGLEELDEDPDVLYFTQQRLMEWSVVALNSNPDALARNHNNLEEIQKAYKPNTSDRSEDEDQDDNQERASKFDVFEAQLLINKNQSYV
jgi:phage head maturation protease